MTDHTHSSDGDNVLNYLAVTKVGRHETVAGQELEPRMRLLRQWQSDRLARTYADLLASPRYEPASRFFLSDIYAPRDFSQRDHDLTRIYESMRRVLPQAILRTLEVVLTLNALTLSLDEALLKVLVDEMGMTDTLTAEQYREAYRRCDNYAERARQIDLITSLGHEIDQLIRKPAVGLALRLARTPARLASWHEHQNFLERGFAAFKHMKGSKEFLEIITGREREILDRIYAGEADPFTLSR